MNPLLIRRRGMMAKEAVLPDGQLEWIETDGVAYIIPDIAPNFVSSSKIKARFADYNGYQYICGNSISSGVFLIYAVLFPNNGVLSLTTCRRFFFNGFPYVYGFSEPIEIEHKWASTNSTVVTAKRNGVVLDSFSYTQSIQQVTTSNKMHIFGIRRYQDGKNGGNHNGLRIYYIDLFSDGNQTNMVFGGKPWRLNGEVGLMDTLTNTFHGNAAGSGAFIGGPNVI